MLVLHAEVAQHALRGRRVAGVVLECDHLTCAHLVERHREENRRRTAAGFENGASRATDDQLQEMERQIRRNGPLPKRREGAIRVEQAV